jgi:3-(3-hydroxy-phenyl)propionate hydroxylase
LTDPGRGDSLPVRMSHEFVRYPFTPKHYPARLPAAAGRGRIESAAVVIAGGGIVGFATAIGLANHGVSSILIEADDGVCIGSRAICFSRRTLEIGDRLGILPALLERGLPWTGGRSYHRDVEVLRFSMPHDAHQRLPPMVNLQQFYMEQFLLDEAERRAALIDIRWQTRVAEIAERGDGVELGLETPEGSYRLRTRWLVGCDGARSTVRDAADLKLEGTSYEGRYVIADIALRSERPVERLAWFDPPSNPGSTILMHRQPQDIWRIDYQLREEEDAHAAVLPQNVIPRIDRHLRMIGERPDWAPIWVSLYKANALTLERYRRGPFLLAGDAAHLLPIFGVRGANSGFEDADNLAWKLALVVKGIAHESLLDSYSEERVFAARENRRFAMKSTEFMTPPSYGFELMRGAVLELATREPWVRSLINPRQTQAIAYSRSPLNREGPDADRFRAGPPPGAIAIEAPLERVANGDARPGYLTELLAPAFTALYFTAGDPPGPFANLERRLNEAAIPFRFVPVLSARAALGARPHGIDAERTVAAAYDASPGTLYLLRPDGHVLGRWRDAAAGDVERAIAATLRPAGSS